VDTQSLLESFGYLVIFGCVFIESGVLLGLVLPLPGFSLVFTAGILASSGKLNLAAIIVTASAGAILGYIAGYYTGKRYGRKLFYQKQTSKYFTEAQGRATENFMRKYGYPTLVIGRFLAIVHNIAPLLAGIAKTPMIPFMVANVLGGILWATTISFMGYLIGNSIPHSQYYLIAFIVTTAVIFNTSPFKRWLSKMTERFEKL